MPTTSDYLSQLQDDKDRITTAFELDSSLTFTDIADKVEAGEIGGGGADLSEYFTQTITSGTNAIAGFIKSVQKMPKFVNSGTSCAFMFSRYQGTTLDVTNFDTSSVTDMNRFFMDCPNITSIEGINSLNISNVANLEACFINCSSLTALDLSNWVLKSSGVQGSYMFYGCSSLEFLDIRNFNFSNFSNSGQMFQNVPNDCEIIVGTESRKSWIASRFSNLTNVKTVEEYEAEQAI